MFSLDCVEADYSAIPAEIGRGQHCWHVNRDAEPGVEGTLQQPPLGRKRTALKTDEGPNTVSASVHLCDIWEVAETV